MDACTAGSEEEIARLLAAGADSCHRAISRPRRHPSGRAGHDSIVTMLLNYKSEVNAQDDNGDSALLWACRMGHIEVVKALLAAGVGLANSHAPTPSMPPLRRHSLAVRRCRSYS